MTTEIIQPKSEQGLRSTIRSDALQRVAVLHVALTLITSTAIGNSIFTFLPDAFWCMVFSL